MKIPITRRTSALGVTALGIAASLMLTSCAGSNESSSGGASNPTNNTSALPQKLVDSAVAAAKKAAGGENLGGSLSMIGITGGAEGDSLTAAMAPFTTATGTKIDYTATQDQSKVVQSALEGGNPPDLVDGQGVGLLQDYAKQGKLLALNDVVGNDMLKANYKQGLLDVASLDGTVYGLWGEADSFSIWYNTKTYNGPKSPANWAELDGWAKKQASSGTKNAPWCMALEAGPGSGFPAQSWIESIFLKMWGPDKMAQWASGKLSWTSPEVKAAFERFGEVATSNTMVNGGPQTVVSTTVADYGNGMFTDPQQCQLSLWGNYIGGLIQAGNPNVKIPGDLSFFQVPAETAWAATAENVAGHVMYAFKNKDSKALRAFLKYWATPEAQALIAAGGHWTVGNSNVPLDAYPNAGIKASAEQLNNAKSLSPGPATTAGSAVVSAWNTAIIGYVQDPGNLDKQLASIQAATGR
jgi:alpha-glucoside transport system substrate-binding protein